MAKTTMKTELGFKIEMTKTNRIAEDLAKIREEIEDRTESMKRQAEALLEQMRQDKVTRIKVRSPGGILYCFEAVTLGEKIKITKPTV
jgi:uncharacterized protein YbbK (DUF523 family)